MVIVSGRIDLARDLFLLLGLAEALQALHAAAEGGDRARALLSSPRVAVETVRRPRFFSRRRATASDAAAAGGVKPPMVRTGGRLTGVSVDGARPAAARARGRPARRPGAGADDGAAVAGAGAWRGARRGGDGAPRPRILRFGFGLAGEALLFLALAGFGGGALGALALLALGAGLGFGLGAAAIFFLAGAGVDQGAGAGLALVVGQRAQHDAGAAPAARGAGRSGFVGGGAAAGGGGRRRGVRRRGGGAGFAGSAWPGARRFTFSTTTTFERPWEKLWRTMP